MQNPYKNQPTHWGTDREVSYRMKQKVRKAMARLRSYEEFNERLRIEVDADKEWAKKKVQDFKKAIIIGYK
jgi:hypothetical protein